MEFPMRFIHAGPDYSTLTGYVPAPYLRKSFRLEVLPEKTELLISGLGFYELYINGRRITKGLLSPYISNPDDIVYYDMYTIREYLQIGENVLGVCLGNGFQNNPGGYPWDFQKARFRGAPALALRLEMTLPDGETICVESDESFRTSPSPIFNDDYRNGEYYDARRELPGWCSPGFDDGDWAYAKLAPLPRGEARLCEAEPILPEREIRPIAVAPLEDGYVYDFGENNAGLCRLSIRGEAGQILSLYHAERIKDGKLDRRSISFDDNDYVQKDIYICKGGETESYMPSFTYHGFQYVLVKGLRPEQATQDLLTFVVFHTRLRERGGFVCSDETANRLQAMVRRSTLSNFHHFPTDCPQREKNGWTADAALSTEHTLLNLEPDKNYREWMHNIRRAQAMDGALPGIIPTSGWGFAWGNGPAWDSVLVYVPYMTYLYRGDKIILRENAHAILRYLDYLTTRIRPDGLICCGLGDWCPVGRGPDQYKAPLEFTDTVLSMDICEKAAYIFGELDMEEQKDFALKIYNRLRKAGRERLLDLSTMTALGSCQTSQAMAIFYSLFDQGEKPEAFRRLLGLIHERDDHMDVGVLGGRVIFHVLSDYGCSDLAYRMITRPDYPSYGCWLARGATTLRESFWPEDRDSLNHHFWGDISHWFLRHLAGIHYHPHRKSGEADIRPAFVEQLTFAEGWHEAPEGKIWVRWERDGDRIQVKIEVPEALSGRICLPAGYLFDDGVAVKPLCSGCYTVSAV